MSIFVPWLVDAAKLTGYPVVEIKGWQDRGHGGMTSVEGVVCHHTAGPKTGEYPSLTVVRDGRAGLVGPLANFGLGRSGTVYVNAAGLAYHAGTSAWAGFKDLNGKFLGIEAEDDGDGTWTREQIDAYPRLCAALLYFMRRNSSRVCAHRECATPAGRKPDPTGINMNSFRSTVADLLTDPLRFIPLGGAPTGGISVSTRDEVWQAPIPDLYTAKADDTLPAFSALGWANAHAAFARQASEAALAEIRAMRSGSVGGPAQLTDADVNRVADAVIEKLAGRLQDN